jgi:hypothetical protein
VPGEHLPLELQHLWLVDFEDDRAVRPPQPVGAGVQTGGQDDDLAHTGADDLAEIVVEVAGAGALECLEVLAELALQLVVRCPAVKQVRPFAAHRPAEHLGIRVDGERFVSLGLQRTRPGNEQRSGSDACRDVPSISFATHAADHTRPT